LGGRAERDPRYRLLVLLTAFCSLRWGEVSALRRGHIAEDGSWVRVSVAHTEVAGRGVVVGPPKSRAGLRTVVVPKAIRPDLVEQLRERVGQGSAALVFTGDQGRASRRTNFAQRVKWTATVEKLGMKGVHVHDLRHAGNVWTAQTRVSTRDLMARMGHDDMRAALIYQRATQDAADRIADGLSELADRHRGTTVRPRPAEGTQRARATTESRNDKVPGRGVLPLTWAFFMERMTGIEPAYSAWEADVLPLNYIRAMRYDTSTITLRH
jgi:hypothetical protein